MIIEGIEGEDGIFFHRLSPRHAGRSTQDAVKDTSRQDAVGITLDAEVDLYQRVAIFSDK